MAILLASGLANSGYVFSCTFARATGRRFSASKAGGPAHDMRKCVKLLKIMWNEFLMAEPF